MIKNGPWVRTALGLVVWVGFLVALITGHIPMAG